MFLIERIAHKTAVIISQNLKLDKDREMILDYGAFNILQIAWSFLLIIILGTVLNVLEGAVVFAITVSILRKYSGGVHASSPNQCAVLGAIISVLFPLFVNSILGYTDLTFIILVFVAFYPLLSLIVYKLAPVDSPAKPIVKVKKIQQLKKRSILVLNIFFIITFILIIHFIKLNSYFFIRTALYILAGLIWQTFTLTSMGHNVIHRLDSFIKI